MGARELREYLTETGRSPFRDWLHGLRDADTRARVRVRSSQAQDIETAKRYGQIHMAR